MSLYYKSYKRSKLEFKLAILRIIKHFKNLNPEHQFLVFSDPRGGSTWMAEMLRTIPKTTIIWEPFNIHEVKMVERLGFGWRQYIPDNQPWFEALQVMNKIFSGKVINEWTMLYTSLKDYYSANQLIIKICRGNMLLPWITSQFNFTYAPIYLVRHPFAVVLSQIKQGGWNNPYKKFEIPSTPYNEIYWNHSTFLGKLTTREEILTFIWCLTNQVPLNHQQNNQDWITVYYENLLLNPTIEINRIFDRWNLSIPVRIQEKYRKKSPTAINPKDIKDPHDQLSSWQHELNPDQISRMIQVLKYFDIQHYSAEDVMPKVIMK